MAAERDPSERLALSGAPLEAMTAVLDELGEPRFRARQLFAAVYRRRVRTWDELTDFGKGLRARLAERCTLDRLPVAQTFESRDGTRRYLFEVAGGQRIESVFIPEPRRDTFCISTQVGCAVECLFCVTGKLPMRRNLTAAEIVAQVLALADGRGREPRRLNVVLMGMGEPLHNYDNVSAALRLLAAPEGLAISPRRITLSTSGVVPALERLGREPLVPNLAISLNATTDAVRDILIPINTKWNIACLLAACRAFPLEPRRRITFEYVLIAGVNDADDDARRLVSLLAGLRPKVNLIPLNADPWVPLRPSSESRVLRFQKILTNRHLTATIRRPRGSDVSAACGMLAGRAHARGDDRQPPPKPAGARDLERLAAAAAR